MINVGPTDEQRSLLSASAPGCGDEHAGPSGRSADGRMSSCLPCFFRRRKRGGRAQGALSMLGLAAIVFYEVSGGPFGSEDAVSAGGPFLALLGFTVMPLVWSVPEAFVVAELATAMPENAGYAAWVAEAFGPFWGFQEGYWSWVSGVADNAVYPLLFLLYLCGDCDSDSQEGGGGSGRLGEYDHVVASLLDNPVLRWLFLVITILVLTLVNYRGIHIVGRTSIILAGFTLLPFIIMVFLGIPRVIPSRWLEGPIFGQPLRARQLTNGDVKWRPLVNVLFWNLNYFDSASTLAGEVQMPQSTFPKALLTAVIVIVLNYVLPLAIGIGITSSLPPSASGVTTWRVWDDGALSSVARTLGGVPLHFWVVAAAGVSNIGMFLAEMSSDSFQLAGMAERGMLPAIFNERSRYGTPTVGILLSAIGVVIIGTTPLDKVVELLNFLYCFAALLEFAAFVKLRISKPGMHRPYRVPVSTKGAIAMLAIPSFFIVLVLCLSSMRTFLACACIMVVGFFLPGLLERAKKMKWCRFLDPNDALGREDAAHEEQDVS